MILFSPYRLKLKLFFSKLLDLEENDTFNEMAKNASREEISGRFRMEHFDYGNSVIVERMMENWNATEFIGVTVSTLLVHLQKCYQNII